MRRLLGISVLFSITACGVRAPLPETPATDRLGTPHLPASDKGCALTLSSRAAKNGPIFIEYLATGDARVVLDGTSLHLTRKSAEGALGDTLFQKQIFAGGPMAAHLSLRKAAASELSEGNSHVGVLTLTESGGWSTIVPILGAVECH